VQLLMIIHFTMFFRGSFLANIVWTPAALHTGVNYSYSKYPVDVAFGEAFSAQLPIHFTMFFRGSFPANIVRTPACVAYTGVN
jgi:hypothetical protein